MKIYPVIADNFKLDGGACFGVVPKTLWSRNYPSDENNLINITDRCLLIEESNRLILVDSGIGDKQDEKFYSYLFMFGDDSIEKYLKSHGFNFDDITDVVFTHLHFDHCGGSIKRNADKTKFEPVFKNAKYWVSKQQWDWAINPNRREAPSFLKENILPMMELGKLNFINENKAFVPNVVLKIFNGHTKGQVVPFINYKGKTLVYLADFIPSSAHIPLSHIAGYDVFPLLALEEKEIFLNRAADEDYILIFEHDFYVECCTVQRTEKGIKIKDKFKLEEI